MYHDQGHIALKTAGFRRAVNVTLGLPIVRTSVAHGTAFDIAWQGIADPSSLIEAVRVAARLVAARDISRDPFPASGAHDFQVDPAGFDCPRPDGSDIERFAGSSPVLQPIMPLDLPVKVRSWELTVYPRSHIRRWLGVTRPAQARM